MAIIDHWHEKHPRQPAKGRLILYILLFILILFLMFKADTFVKGFANIFFPSDADSTVEENHPR